MIFKVLLFPRLCSCNWETQGRGNYFELGVGGGANVSRSPGNPYPKLKTHRIWPTMFWERPKLTCKKRNILTAKSWGGGRRPHSFQVVVASSPHCLPHDSRVPGETEAQHNAFNVFFTDNPDAPWRSDRRVPAADMSGAASRASMCVDTLSNSHKTGARALAAVYLERRGFAVGRFCVCYVSVWHVRVERSFKPLTSALRHSWRRGGGINVIIFRMFSHDDTEVALKQ